jgi:hypothetical protein
MPQDPLTSVKSLEQFLTVRQTEDSCNVSVISIYRVIINYCPIAAGVGNVVECAASLIT